MQVVYGRTLPTRVQGAGVTGAGDVYGGAGAGVQENAKKFGRGDRMHTPTPSRRIGFRSGGSQRKTL